MKPMLLFPAAVLGLVVGLAIGFHGQNEIRKQMQSEYDQLKHRDDKCLEWDIYR